MSSPVSDTAVSQPAPALRPFIKEYAGFRASGVPPGFHYGLPSSDVDLIISLGRPIDVVCMPSSKQRPAAFAALVVGMQEAPAVARQEGEVFGLHVYIKPLAVRAILGVAGTEISSLVVHFSDLWGNCAGDLVEMLLAATTWRQRFAILDRAFLSKFNPPSPPPEIAWAWRRMTKDHGTVPVQRLADEIGWSRQHFIGRFREAVGVTPKSAARVLRFERACRLIACRANNGERPGLADVALSCGYFDQSHMTREWKALAGCSPKAWISSELPFLQDYEIGGGDNESDDAPSMYQPYV